MVGWLVFANELWTTATFAWDRRKISLERPIVANKIARRLNRANVLLASDDAVLVTAASGMTLVSVTLVYG